MNGNQFGDDGCEALISQMEASNNGHKLDSLDEDNEPDDDEEEDEEQFKNAQSRRSRPKVDGPKDSKWTVLGVQSKRYYGVMRGPKWTVLRGHKGSKVDGPGGLK